MGQPGVSFLQSIRFQTLSELGRSSFKKKEEKGRGKKKLEEKKWKRGKEVGKKKWVRKKEKEEKERKKPTPKNIFSFFSGYSTSFCLSEQAINISLCICMPISAQLLQIQVLYESALAQGLPKHSILL